MGELYLYIEQLLLCCICLLIMWGICGRNWNNKQSKIIAKMHLNTLLAALLNIAWAFLEGKPELRALNAIDQVLCLVVYVILSYRWLEFCTYQIPRPLWKSNRGRRISQIPALLTILMIACSPWTGWVFSIDEQAVYQRGPLFLVYGVITYLYMLTATICSVQAARGAQTPTEKKQYRVQSFFILPPMAAGVTEWLLDPSATLMPWGITLSLLSMTLIAQDRQIMRDSLTNLRNRFNFDNFLRVKMTQYDIERPGDPYLYLILGDLDRFKLLNDTFGHTEGDRALQIVADALHTTCMLHDGFVARIGGDEFAILLERYTEEQVEEFCSCLRAALEKKMEGDIFYLNISLGYAKYRPQMTMTELMAAADRRLYEDKRRR